MSGVKKSKRLITQSYKLRANLAHRLGILNRKGPKWMNSGTWTLDMAPVTNAELSLTVHARAEQQRTSLSASDRDPLDKTTTTSSSRLAPLPTNRHTKR